MARSGNHPGEGGGHTVRKRLMNLAFPPLDSAAAHSYLGRHRVRLFRVSGRRASFPSP